MKKNGGLDDIVTFVPFFEGAKVICVHTRQNMHRDDCILILNEIFWHFKYEMKLQNLNKTIMYSKLIEPFDIRLISKHDLVTFILRYTVN